MIILLLASRMTNAVVVLNVISSIVESGSLSCGVKIEDIDFNVAEMLADTIILWNKRYQTSFFVLSRALCPPLGPKNDLPPR